MINREDIYSIESPNNEDPRVSATKLGGISFINKHQINIHVPLDAGDGSGFGVAKGDGLAVHHVLLHRGEVLTVQGEGGGIPVA